MQIVIDISDRMYTTICGFDECECNPLESYIKNGTPLLKGHGDLIDRKRICKAAYVAEDNLTGSDMSYDEMDFYNYGIDSMWDKLQNAEPIIIADKEE